MYAEVYHIASFNNELLSKSYVEGSGRTQESPEYTQNASMSFWQKETIQNRVKLKQILDLTFPMEILNIKT